MQVNWFTVIAQIINFLILVWLMKRYLYKPILQAIDEREKRIASDLSAAKIKIAEALKQQAEFQEKNESFDRHKKKLMDEASAEAAEQRLKLLDSAKKEAADIKAKLEKSAKSLEQNLSEELSQKTQNEVFSITKKVLSELATTNLEEQTVHVFIGKINALTAAGKKQFIDAFHGSTSPILIKSAFDLAEKDKKSIKVAIGVILGEGARYEFKTDSKIVGGIELSTKGYKLSWSLASYVDSLEKSMATKTIEPHKAVKL